MLTQSKFGMPMYNIGQKSPYKSVELLISFKIGAVRYQYIIFNKKKSKLWLLFKSMV